jgi:GSH-dependent disulfide-bond oxidoreductase
MYARAGESKFSGINAPTAGSRTIGELPQGSGAGVQLYSLATPNGQKVSILLEELGIEYDAHRINIMESDQFKSGYVNVNPNSKIPAVVDIFNGKEVNLFESGSIMLYFAEKHKRFISDDIQHRAATLNWLFWQMAGTIMHLNNCKISLRLCRSRANYG